MNSQDLKKRIKEIIIVCTQHDSLPSQIADDGMLFGEGLGLDSIDALDIAVALEGEFSVPMNGRPEVFKSVAALAAYIESAMVGAELAIA